MSWTPVSLIRVIGLLLCSVSVLLALFHPTTGPKSQASTVLGLILGGVSSHIEQGFSLATPLLIAIMLWRCTRAPHSREDSAWVLALLALQTILSLLCAEELEFIVAVEAGLLLSPQLGALWVFSQALLSWLSALLFPQLMHWLLSETDPVRRSLGIGLFMLIAVLYNLFAFGLGWLAATERRQTLALANANAALISAQRAASQSARLNERLAIARDLHDAVGHQLTALSISLQVASHLPTHARSEPVREAYSITQKLLADVRAVVTTMREPADLDFSEALTAFGKRVESPEVHLALEPLPEVFRKCCSYALLRCAQEIITNASKHANANNLWIRTFTKDNCYYMEANDDGVGAFSITAGNGLRGIVERIRELDGTVEFRTAVEGGFGVMIKVPFVASL